MDFKDTIKQLSERIDIMKDNIGTEEATKNAFIMPFIQALGYDVFNPFEVVPEFTCDIGTKKGEKIDYAIMKDNSPIILIECKHWNSDLNLHDNQLLRYFHTSAAKFGVLTNGVTYQFFTDLATPNKMDEKPFLEFKINDLKENQIDEIKKFHKSYFDITNIISSASELKYMNELTNIIKKEFNSPSSEFVRILTKQAHEGIITAKLLEQFTDLTKRSINNHINELISDRLKLALKSNEKQNTQDRQQATEEKQDLSNTDDPLKIITTEEEIQAFLIVKAILASKIDIERIFYKDTQSYFSIILDNKVTRVLCRLYFNSPKKKYIIFFDENKKEIRQDMSKVNDIYKYGDLLIKVLGNYEKTDE